MNKVDVEYLALCEKILMFGEEHSDRTNTGVLSLFGETLKFNLDEGFPILTTKKMFWYGIVAELLWFLSGSTNYKDLPPSVQKIWSPWAKPDGDLGAIYGQNLRRWKTNKFSFVSKNFGAVSSNLYFEELDQIKTLIEGIKNSPDSRRHVISTWNAGELANMQLPPCHGVATQFHVHNNGTLSCLTMQRSADVFIGLPFNISSYALLTNLIAHLTGLKPGTLHITLGNAHIYKNHVQQIKEQLTRNSFELPTLAIDNVSDIDKLEIDQFKLIGYTSHPAIKGSVAI